MINVQLWVTLAYAQVVINGKITIVNACRSVVLKLLRQSRSVYYANVKLFSCTLKRLGFNYPTAAKMTAYALLPWNNKESRLGCY